MYVSPLTLILSLLNHDAGMGSRTVVLVASGSQLRNQILVSPQRIDICEQYFLKFRSDASGCGQYERIMSDYYDYVSTASFCGKFLSLVLHYQLELCL
jgi:hypothetical protein